MIAVTIVPCARNILIENKSTKRKERPFYLYYMRARDFGDIICEKSSVMNDSIFKYR